MQTGLRQRLFGDAVLVLALAWLAVDLGNDIAHMCYTKQSKASPKPLSRLQKQILASPDSEDKDMFLDLFDIHSDDVLPRVKIVSSILGQQNPVYMWLLVSYALLIVCRLMGSLGEVFCSKESGDFLLNMRHQNFALRHFGTITWLFVLPFYSVWTFWGSCWLHKAWTETPHCLPEGIHLGFLFVWQALSYAWIITHIGLGGVAWFLERCCRGLERDLMQVEDEDVRNRWGQVSQIGGYISLPRHKTTGLTPTEISTLPSHVVAAHSPRSLDKGKELMECSVCLAEMQAGEHCRQLPSCGHVFHRPCIDLWLLRNKDCPLCKQAVAPWDGNKKTI